MSFKPAHIALVAWIVLSVIFWGNLFRFHPSMIDGVYDQTSEASVVGRLARAAADGFFENTDLGVNLDPSIRRRTFTTIQLRSDISNIRS